MNTWNKDPSYSSYTRKIKQIRKLKDVYDRNSQLNNSDYLIGLYNGAVAVLAILEDKDEFKFKDRVQRGNGHIEHSNPKYNLHKSICDKLNETYIKKNQDYGGSYGKLLAKRGDVAGMIRLEDKLSRLDTLIERPALVSDESFDDTLLDLANYAIMWLVERKFSRTVSCDRPENVE